MKKKKEPDDDKEKLRQQIQENLYRFMDILLPLLELLNTPERNEDEEKEFLALSTTFQQIYERLNTLEMQLGEHLLDHANQIYFNWKMEGELGNVQSQKLYEMIKPLFQMSMKERLKDELN